MKGKIYFNASYPYGHASTNRVHNIAKGLTQNNVQVEIIITNPTEKNYKTLNNNMNGIYEEVNFTYISNTTVRHKNIFVRKFIDYYCYFKVYFKILFTSSDDFMILVGGAYFDFRLLIPLLVKFKKTKLFLEINEYPHINSQNNLLKKIKNYVFYNLQLPFFDGFIVISEALSNLLQGNGISKSKILKIPVLHEKGFYKDFINLDIKIPFIIHSGSIANEEKDGMLGCLQAFKLAIDILNTDIKYVIATNYVNSTEIEKLKEFIKLNNLQNNVIFENNLSKIDLIKYYTKASLAIVNKSESKQNIYGFATKISEYVAFKIPLILTSVGEINYYFVNDFNAIIIPPNDYKLLSEKIILLLSNTEKANTLAENAVMLSETDFNPKIQGKNLSNFIENQ